MPTRLGNILRAAESYPHDRYGADAVLTWPRLFPLLPDRLTASLTAARAEIEQVVVAGLFSAFSDGVELAQPHLVAAISETLPLAVTMREDIDRLREWARTRTRPASGDGASPRPGPLAARFG